MTLDISKLKFPDDVTARIHELAVKTGKTEDEVVADLMRRFFELVDESKKTDVPCFIQKVRKVLEEASDVARD